MIFFCGQEDPSFVVFRMPLHGSAGWGAWGESWTEINYLEVVCDFKVFPVINETTSHENMGECR
jgi:hypothetical protein